MRQALPVNHLDKKNLYLSLNIDYNYKVNYIGNKDLKCWKMRIPYQLFLNISLPFVTKSQDKCPNTFMSGEMLSYTKLSIITFYCRGIERLYNSYALWNAKYSIKFQGRL